MVKRKLNRKWVGASIWSIVRSSKPLFLFFFISFLKSVTVLLNLKSNLSLKVLPRLLATTKLTIDARPMTTQRWLWFFELYTPKIKPATNKFCQMTSKAPSNHVPMIDIIPRDLAIKPSIQSKIDWERHRNNPTKYPKWVPRVKK